MPVERTQAVAVGPGGLNLTPFSRLVCRQPDYEIHYVELNIIIAQAQLPLRLAVAAFLRAPWDDGTCPRIAEMVAVAIPVEIQRSSLILTSGQVLFPLDDSPHITHDGIILHGRSALQRAMVYRILHHTECLPSPSCTVGVGQARPPLPSPFHSYTLCRQCTEPLKAPCHRSHHGSCRNLSLPPIAASRNWWSQRPFSSQCPTCLWSAGSICLASAHRAGSGLRV